MRTSHQLNRVLWMAASFVIPLKDGAGWKNLKYRGIAQNSIEFKNDKLMVGVNSSASPLFFAFKETKKISAFSLKGRRWPALHLKAGLPQGTKENDDFALRLGLVVRGEQKMGFFQRTLAPDWIVQIERSLPDQAGIDRIEFFNFAEAGSDSVGRKQNRKIKNIFETQLAPFLVNGSFDLHKKLADMIDCVGVFFSFDGDNSKSRFEVEIESISFSE